jgi:hypothetical protein
VCWAPSPARWRLPGSPLINSAHIAVPLSVQLFLMSISCGWWCGRSWRRRR